VNSFLQYHLNMLDFHSHLESEHSYMADPWGWLLQLRPTSFYWEDLTKRGDAVDCGAERCVQAITSVGNPFVWWAGFLALFLVVFMALRRNDWRAWAIIAGYGGTYLPWFLFANRTIFTFYTVVIAPFVVLALVYALGLLTQLLPLADPSGSSASSRTQLFRIRAPRWAGALAARRRSARFRGFRGSAGTSEREASDVPVTTVSRRIKFPAVRGSHRGAQGVTGTQDAGSGGKDARARRIGWIIFGVVTTLIVLAAAFWWPVWTGQTVAYWFWRLHMWMPSWV